jgi:hypothetical protein
MEGSVFCRHAESTLKDATSRDVGPVDARAAVWSGAAEDGTFLGRFCAVWAVAPGLSSSAGTAALVVARGVGPGSLDFAASAEDGLFPSAAAFDPGLGRPIDVHSVKESRCFAPSREPQMVWSPGCR